MKAKLKALLPQFVFAPMAVFLFSLGVSLPGWAAMSLDQARSLVRTMELSEEPAESIIDRLVDEGLGLEEVTALAVSAAVGDQYRVALAQAALCMARGEEQFESVGNIAIEAVGGTTADSQIVDSIAAFRPGACADIQLKAPPGSLSNADGPQAQGTSPQDVSPSS